MRSSVTPSGGDWYTCSGSTGGSKLEEQYYRPTRSDRECRYWWFDGWDCMVNATLSTMGSTRIATEEGEVAIDPHIHSLFSHCSISQPERIIRRAVAIGLGAIAIMDHNDIRGARDAVRCAAHLKSRGEIPEDFVVIPGVEINTKVGHVGALFVDEDFPRHLSPCELVDAIHRAGGVAVAVHPYHSTGIRDAVFDAPFDAVEIECGSVFGRKLVAANRALVEDARLAGTSKLGSSDAHYVRAMGSCYTLLSGISAHSLESIKHAIISGNCTPKSSVPYERLVRLLGPIGKLK